MKKAPNKIAVLLTCRCPHCRAGYLFNHQNPYSQAKKILDMKANCDVCGQKTELETGFWWGTGYVSYALSIAISVFNVIWFSLFVGWKNDYSFIWYLVINAALLLLSLPFIVRLSRMLWLDMFVKYDKEAFKN